MDLAGSETGAELKYFFDMDKIIFTLKEDNYLDKEEWFLLRIMNLLIFMHDNNVKLC